MRPLTITRFQPISRSPLTSCLFHSTIQERRTTTTTTTFFKKRHRNTHSSQQGAEQPGSCETAGPCPPGRPVWHGRLWSAVASTDFSSSATPVPLQPGDHWHKTSNLKLENENKKINKTANCVYLDTQPLNAEIQQVTSKSLLTYPSALLNGPTQMPLSDFHDDNMLWPKFSDIFVYKVRENHTA